MALTEKQTGVLIGIVIGMIIAISIVVAGILWNPFSYALSLTDAERLTVAFKSALLPLLFLVISVARLAKHRFFTPEDIDGGAGFASDSERALVLQTLLQNTLEQFCIAVVVYAAWAVVMPSTWLSVVPLAALAFAVGRILFFGGYAKGAPSRALGFALTFYPSVLMLLGILGFLIWQQFM
ncbi:MAPEG family protein [Thiorhodococcus minor]|uniref:MAPEG family protein n=1 Tax=Thiorhodococcus minor TaxID=57489 RepID=A0A6M0K5R0_9GAMM|nr:MAPEG family protein [Thiorhodococcus minor]NEV65116.1 MAPEG family protein [Thiorhodococcus minor]